MKNKRRKIIAIIISLSIILTSIGTAFATVPEGTNQVIDSVKKVFNLSEDAKPKPMTQGQYKMEDKPKLIYQSTRTSLVGEDLYKQDIYNFSAEETLELYKQGYTLEEIATADDIGNQINVEPRKLLEMKRKEKKNFDEIKTQIKSERREENFQKLKVKYYKQYEELIKQSINKQEEQLAILSFVDTNEIGSIKDLVQKYKKSRHAVFKSSFNPKQKKLSKQTMNKYGLTTQESVGITDAELERVAKVAQKKNKDIKEVLKGLKLENSKVRRLDK